MLLRALLGACIDYLWRLQHDHDSRDTSQGNENVVGEPWQGSAAY